MLSGSYVPVPIVDTSKLLYEEVLEYNKLGLNPYDLATIYLDDLSQQAGYSSVLGLFLDKVARHSEHELSQRVEQRIRENKAKDANEPELMVLGKMRRPIHNYGQEYDLVTGHSSSVKYAMARHLSARLGVPVFKVPELFRHPHYPFMIAKLDYIAFFLNPETGEFDNPVNLQCRTASYWRLNELKEEIPNTHDITCRVQMSVANLNESIIVYLCDNNEGGEVLYRVPRSKAIEQKIIQCGKNFWTQNVEKEILPFPKTPTDIAARDIALYARQRLQYSRPPEIIERGMPELVQHYTEVKELVDSRKESLENAENELARIKLQLSGFMLDKSEATCGDLKMKWREYKSRSVDYNGLALAYPDIYNQFVMENANPGFEIRIKKNAKKKSEVAA